MSIAAAAQQKTPSKTSAAKQTASKQTASKQTASKQTAKQPAAKAGKQAYGKAASKQSAKAKQPARPRYYTQMQPSQERYKEIQQALASKGYFSGEPDGSWGASSTEALKRFQHDQNLSEDGKIDSLSLIALGLGPNRR